MLFATGVAFATASILPLASKVVKRKLWNYFRGYRNCIYVYHI